MEDQKTKKARQGQVDGEVDRLSDLPYYILLYMLSLVDTLDTVKTCVLSKRWRYLWKDISTLKLYSSNFRRIECFRKFVSMVLSGRDGNISLHNLDFDCQRGFGRVHTQFLDSVINYAVSQNVQQLKLSLKNYSYYPARMFTCLSLTSLKIEGYNTEIIFPRSLDSPALASLHLGHYVRFSADGDGRAEPFGNCGKLKTLIIAEYTIEENKGAQAILCIANDSLANLTIGSSYKHYNAPRIELFTPNLRSFVVKLNQMTEFSGQKLDSLEDADILWLGSGDFVLASTDMRRIALIFMDMLQLLSNVKSMTISSSTFKILSYVPLEAQPPFFSNLKSLKVTAYQDILDGALDYLLQNSPDVEVTVIDRRRRSRGRFKFC